MRCKCLWNLVLTTTALAALGSALAADDENRPPDARLTLGAAPVNVSADAGSTRQDAANATPAGTNPKTVPTLAKRGPTVMPPIEVASRRRTFPIVETTTAAASGNTTATDESLQPIPDAMESGPVTIEAASFKGVVPGLSTKDDVEKAWGKPKKTAGRPDAPVHLYTVEPFNRVEVSYSGGKVASIIVRFDKAFPAEGVAKQLDLATIRPVLVSNEMGEVIGLSYPERGVLFAFEAGKEPGKPSMKVAQLVLEPISAEPFVLRAETVLDSRRDLCRRDLEHALTLEPENARAHWLHARVLVAMEQYDKAAKAAGEAVRLEPDNPHYRVTRAQVLSQLGRLSEAIDEAQKAADNSQQRPHVKARALCLIGDLTASGAKPDYRKAMTFHNQALQIADPLTSDPHPAIRLAAKETLLDAHLGAGRDIAFGQWKDKNKAAARWIERAVVVADDLVSNEGADQEVLLRVHVHAMANYVAVRGALDPEATLKAMLSAGEEAIAVASDPIHKAQLESDLGTALSDAVQVYQMRSDNDTALKLGQQAAGYLAKAHEAKQSNTSALTLGRLYFRLGAIDAVGRHDHRSAVAWFEKAVPLMERPSPNELAAEIGRHGEAFVSMGVSFWEAGQQQKAVALTEKGIKSMELAVQQGLLDRSALAVPYANLATMHRKLGSTDQADRYQKMAGRAKEQLK